MPMIQGIDGGLLINAMRQGREDRYRDDQRKLEAEQAQAAADRQRRLSGVMGNLFGPAQPSGGGVMGQMGAPAADEPAMSAGAATQPGMAPSQPSMASNQPGRRQVNPEALQELLVLDPEMFGKVTAGLKTMSEMDIKQFQVRNDAMGAAAMYLRRLPPQQRAQAFRQIAPQLAQAGWSEQELAQTDLDDMALAGYQALGMDLEKAIAADLKEREFRAGKTVPVNSDQGVAQVVPVMNERGEFVGNRASMIVQPYGQPAAAQPPAAAIAELRANPGTAAQFDEIFGPGAAARVLGGQPGGGAPFAQ